MFFKSLFLIALLCVPMARSQASPLVLAKSGRSNYRIVVPDKNAPVVEYAAAELQHFVREMSGVTLPIVTESKAGNGPAILLGASERVRGMALGNSLGKLSEDGVLIRTVGQDIVLLGQNDRGQLYSVYVLLEHFLGVRFLAKDCTVVPKHRSVTLLEMDYAYSPPFMYREVLYYDAFPREIAARQRLNGPYTKCDVATGGKLLFHPFVHSFDDLIPPEKYFKEHPEYYSLIDGKRHAAIIDSQLCLTNPDVLKVAIDQVMKWIDEHPDATSIDVSQNDGQGWCQCEKCAAVVKEEGSQSGPILRFVNAIADAVAEKHPNLWIDTLAYAYSTKPPAITKPRKNVIIRLCHAGCYFHGFEKDGLGAGLVDNIAGWAKLSKRIFVWHYATNFGCYAAPNQNLQGLAKDIKYYGSHGLNGVMVQCNHQGSGSELAELRQYLVAQLLWDPSRDPMEIRREFCEGYYGPAAKDALQFLALMDTLSENPEKHAFASWDPQTTAPPEFVAESLRILNHAKSLVKDRKIANRIDKLLLPLWYMQIVSPDRYGLAKEDAPALWVRFKDVVKTNNITFVREAYRTDENGRWLDEPSMPGWIAEMDARRSPLPEGVVCDLWRMFDKAKSENCADWRTATVKKGEQTLVSLFQHPRPEGTANAIYEVQLPTIKAPERLVFQFSTTLTGASANGVRFAVDIDGRELWGAVQVASGQGNLNSIMDRSIDLSQWAGQSIKLILQVDSLGDATNDWANWVQPRITLQSAGGR